MEIFVPLPYNGEKYFYNVVLFFNFVFISVNGISFLENVWLSISSLPEKNSELCLRLT